MNGMMLKVLFFAGERVNARQARSSWVPVVIKINIRRGSTCNIAVVSFKNFVPWTVDFPLT